MNNLYTALMYVVPLILSLTVHEFCHAWAARALGDDTAEKQGRFTLNPLSHIDPIGTLILPIGITLMRGFPAFAWAKPVPVEPSRFRRDISMRNGMMLTAFAGPLSNLVMLLVCALLMKAVGYGLPLPAGLVQLLGVMMPLNAGLFIFNMIPIFPLDGHKVVSGLLPHDLAERYDRFNYQVGNYALIGLMIFGGRFMGPPIGLLLRSVYALTGLA